jgi:hypothetical protein
MEFIIAGNPCNDGYIRVVTTEIIEIMKLVRIKLLRLLQVGKWYVKNPKMPKIQY